MKKPPKARITATTIERRLAEKSAKVTITVVKDKFRDILNEGGATEAVMSTQGEHKRVHLKIDPTTLVIKRPGARLQFKIASADPTNVFQPIGIAFWRKRGSRKDRHGLLNFKPSQIRLGKQCLYVTDSFKDTGKGDHYKFSIVIQRAKDGAIGIIDPPIVHEEP